MSTILTVYSYDAFKRYLLPAVNDADYSIFLSENLFHIQHNIQLALEAVGSEWRFSESEEYEIQYLKSHDSCFGKPLVSGRSGADAVVRLLLDGRHVLSILVEESDTYYSVYTHFSLVSAPDTISIGRSDREMISYNYANLNFLSSQHAQIQRNHAGWMFRDLSSENGSYLNNRRVQEAQLRFGDCIDIFGLRIVFLGNEIAVNSDESGCQVNKDALHPIMPTADAVAKHVRRNTKEILHRSPRMISKVEEGEIEIDDAPSPKDEVKNSSVLSVMGSVLSMSLPMLLGCAFMIYASNQSGMNRGLFMYVGLVTAGSSAIFGTIRSVRAMKQARQEYENYENRRNEKYGAYLQGQENLIRGKYLKNADAMKQNYPSAEECAHFTSDNPLLWSRNAGQPGFLTIRLGLGDVPFQIHIKIPDQKFSMTDNALAEIPPKIRSTYRILHDVPVTIDLLEHRLVGIVGGKRLTGSLQVVQNIVAQVAAGCAYTDVKMVFLYDQPKTGLDSIWNYAKWLPHVWNETESIRFIASNKEEASNVVFELNRKFRQRMENASQQADHAQYIAKPYYLLFVASPELLEGELIQNFILKPQPVCGLTAFFLAERYEDLPNECTYIIENDENFCGMYSVSDAAEDRIRIQFDKVTDDELEQLSEDISNLRVRETEVGGDIPQNISFFEMYGIRHPDELNVLGRWKKNRTYESMRALIGQMAGGEPCYLDIHEKYHGPHGLVAGTTGSGKSETLQTYILSMAINFSPDDISFFIIDYKGGGMANLFADLPHMIGQISNLSGNQVHRALLAIQSEKDRREAIFKEYGVKDIRDYTKLYKKNEASAPVPHLIIIIDEFAEMKQEQPDFIQEIVSVSRVGRSLGIHLIMATQKPSGAVSEDIWANSRFKLCLRVQSKQDSLDMLHKPDAAYLTQTGRAYLQVGNDELYELFQSGYSGAPYSEDDDGQQTTIASMLNLDGTPAIEGNHARIARAREKKVQWISMLLGVLKEVYQKSPETLRDTPHTYRSEIASRILDRLSEMRIDYLPTEHNRENLVTLLDLAGLYGYDAEEIVAAEAEFTSAREKLPQQPERTQLETVVAYLKDTADRNGYHHDFSLFLPLLPKSISLHDLPQAALPWNAETVFTAGKWDQHVGVPSLAVSVGLYDDPENQRQDTLVLDFFQTGSIALFGAAATGKTTLLQTMLYGLVMRYSPAEINLYVMEYSSRRFGAFEQCPQVGGIIRDSDGNDRLEKFFMMLTGFLEERKEKLRDSSFETYLAANGMGSLPAIIVVIDNFSSLVSRTNEKYNPIIGRMLKEGPANGIFFVVSAAGTGNGEIPNSMFQNFRTTLTLELNNQMDYGVYMRDAHLRLYPESGVKGRGLASVEGRILEFQTALPLAEEKGQETGDLIRETAKQMAASWTGEKAPAIPSIPEHPVWKEFEGLSGTRTFLSTNNILPFGYDMKYAVPYGLDLADTYVYLISGARKKGKTTLLKILMLSAHDKGGQMVVVDYDDQFERICELTGARRISSELEWYEFLSDFQHEVGIRNKAKAEVRKSTENDKDIFGQMQKFEKIYIFIDDLPDFITRCYKPTEKIPQTYYGLMELILDKCSLHNIFWFVTVDRTNLGTTVGTALYKNFVRDKKGIHLGGAVHTTAMTEMNFDNHPRKTVDNVRPAGVGMIPADNGSSVLEVVVPEEK